MTYDPLEPGPPVCTCTCELLTLTLISKPRHYAERPGLGPRCSSQWFIVLMSLNYDRLNSCRCRCLNDKPCASPSICSRNSTWLCLLGKKKSTRVVSILNEELHLHVSVFSFYPNFCKKISQTSPYAVHLCIEVLNCWLKQLQKTTGQCFSTPSIRKYTFRHVGKSGINYHSWGSESGVLSVYKESYSKFVTTIKILYVWWISASNDTLFRLLG